MKNVTIHKVYLLIFYWKKSNSIITFKQLFCRKLGIDGPLSEEFFGKIKSQNNQKNYKLSTFAIKKNLIASKRLCL